MNKKFPLWFSLIFYWVFTFALLSAALAKTNGHFGYPLDDTYIHMAIGKHLINDGFWGISQSGFSSTTSSPLWTLLIAITYKIMGVNDWSPFILSLAVGTIIIYLCFHLLQNYSNPIRLTGFLILIIVITPLPILTLTGMEHTMHSLCTIGLIYCTAIYLAKIRFDARPLVTLLFLAGLTTITRYEGLFLVFSIVLLFLIKKRFWEGLFIGGAGLLPVTVYGFFSISQSWHFLPNSILLKGNLPGFTFASLFNFLIRLPQNLVNSPYVVMLLIACLIVYLWCERKGVAGKKEKYLVALFVLMTFLHMQFASIGWFFRYDAYIMLTGCMILVDLLNKSISDQPMEFQARVIFNYAIVVVLGILFTIPLAWRIGNAFDAYPIAVMNIYEQQYQMGLFLKEYYSQKSIAANDIGAINYLANIKTLDLFGLANMDVLRAKREGRYDQKAMEDLVTRNDVQIIIIYNSFFEGNVPQNWVEVGRWQIANNVICGNDEVSFYAPSSLWEENVIANLRKYSNQLPSTVRQSGKYVIP